jgi:hypothetical protein
LAAREGRVRGVKPRAPYTAAKEATDGRGGGRGVCGGPATEAGVGGCGWAEVGGVVVEAGVGRGAARGRLAEEEEGAGCEPPPAPAAALLLRRFPPCT